MIVCVCVSNMHPPREGGLKIPWLEVAGLAVPKGDDGLPNGFTKGEFIGLPPKPNPSMESTKEKEKT